MKDPHIIFCKLCKLPVRKIWEEGGNCHNECYWKSVHAAFTPILEDASYSLNSPPESRADKELGEIPLVSAT